MGDDKKRNLFDKLKSAVDQVMPGGAAAAPAPGRKPALPTDRLLRDKVKLTAELPGKAASTSQLHTGPQPGQAKGPPDEILSPRRLAMIDDYMRGEAKIEQMNDPAYMYKIVSDERAYQTRLLIDLRRKLSQSAAEGPAAEELQTKIRRSQAIVQNLFKVLKRITGTQGHTGGTDFLSDKK